MVKCAAESRLLLTYYYLQYIPTEHAFTFPCTAFPLLFYINMHFMGLFDQRYKHIIKSKLKVRSTSRPGFFSFQFCGPVSHIFKHKSVFLWEYPPTDSWLLLIINKLDKIFNN